MTVMTQMYAESGWEFRLVIRGKDRSLILAPTCEKQKIHLIDRIIQQRLHDGQPVFARFLNEKPSYSFYEIAVISQNRMIIRRDPSGIFVNWQGKEIDAHVTRVSRKMRQIEPLNLIEAVISFGQTQYMLVYAEAEMLMLDHLNLTVNSIESSHSAATMATAAVPT